MQRLQRSADLPYPFERYGGGIPNGVVSGGFREHRGAGMNARYGAIPLTGKAEGESPGVVNKPSRDETCNGDAGPVENGYLGERKSRSASPSQRKKSVISDTASAETTDEKTAEDGNRTEKDKLKSIPSESESSVKTRIACKNASERNSANEEKVEKAEKCEDLQSEIEGARAAAKSDADMYSPDKKLTDGKNDERSGPEKLLKIPSLSPHDIAIAKADPSPRTPLSLRSVPLPSLGLVRKPSPVLHSKAPEDASVLEVVKTGTAPCQKEENQSSPDIAGNDLAPVDVPLPALSYLRSSPRGRLRTFEAEKNIVSFSDFLRQKESRQPVSPSKSASRDKVGVASNELVSEIHKVEGLITQKEKDLSSARSQLRETEKSNESIDKASSVVQKKAPSAQDEYATMATRIANAPRRREAKKRPRSGMQPMDSVLRLIVTQNQCRAHAAAAVFRTLCWDTERGLDPAMSPIERMTVPELSGNTTAKMKEKILGIRQAQIDRRRKVRKDYIELRDSWRRNLKAARDMRSKEKIDAVRERDRFLLLSTKGHSALLTSRTSSGRTSTKVIPSLSANGQMNGTAELDSQLAEIEAKGGTPGSRAIWSKTLADIPAQDISRLPTDCFSVLMDDPLAEHHAARSVNPWQFEEKLVFLEKYITYSKNFRKIASFLEHKSSRDCSYFYYSNKLDLGLKQLAKDAASMKRKGLLRAFLFDLAKKRSHCYSRDPQSGPCTPAIRNAISAVPNASNIFDRHFIGTGRVVMGGHRRPDSAPLKRSERILRENGCLDLSGIDRRAFGSAIARYGTNWALVASHLSIPRKSSSHFREYYRKNRRRFEADETNGKSRTNGGGRGPNSKHSPRMSPKSSPKSSSSRGKRSEAALKDGIPDIVLVEGVRPSSAKRPRKGDERCPDERALLEDFRTATKSESDGKKLRPTATWTVEEGAQFRALFKQYGRDWKAIAELMRPKTPTQVKGYWRKVSREVGDGVSVANAKSSKSEKRQADSENSNEMGAECARPGKIQGQSKNAGGSSSAISELGKAGEKKAKGEGSNNSDEVMMAVETCSKAVSRTEVIEDRMEIKDDGEVWKVKKGEGGLVEQRIGRASPPPSASSKLPMLRSFRPPFLRSAPAPVDRKEKIYPPVPNGGMSRSTQNANGDKGRPDGCDSSLLQNDLEKAAESYGVLELLESRLRKAEEEHMRKKE